MSEECRCYTSCDSCPSPEPCDPCCQEEKSGGSWIWILILLFIFCGGFGNNGGNGSGGCCSDANGGSSGNWLLIIVALYLLWQCQNDGQSGRGLFGFL